MKNLFSFAVTSLFLFAILTGCQSTPTRYDEKAKGIWTTKVLVKDKESSRSYLLLLKFQTDDQKNARVDISTTLGQPVAALVLKGNSVRYILMESKRVYYGPASTESLKPILSAPIDPRWLVNIFYEKAFEDKNWQCVQDKSFLKECRQLQTGTVVKWTDRAGARRLIQLEHKRADLQIQVMSFSDKVDNTPNTFELKTPEGFREIKLK